MNPSEKIQMRISRDVGQVYNASFRFMRQNRSVLFKSITYYIMPFILVGGFLIFNSISEFIIVARNGADGNWLPIGLAIGEFILGGIIMYVVYTAYITLVYEHMRLYHLADDPSAITHKDVWRATRKRFFMGLANVLVYGVLMWILSSIAGFIFYIIGAMGLLVTAATGSPVAIIVFYVIAYILYAGLLLYLQSISFPMVFVSAFERIDIFSAFGRSFSMVNKKGSIWNAIGSAFLGASIMRILYVNMVTLPVGIVIGILFYYDVDPTQSFNTENIWFILVFKVILPLCTVVYFYTIAIFYITQAFEALSLHERHTGQGLYQKVEKIGTRKDVGPEYYDLSY